MLEKSLFVALAVAWSSPASSCSPLRRGEACPTRAGSETAGAATRRRVSTASQDSPAGGGSTIAGTDSGTRRAFSTAVERCSRHAPVMRAAGWGSTGPGGGARHPARHGGGLACATAHLTIGPFTRSPRASSRARSVDGTSNRHVSPAPTVSRQRAAPPARERRKPCSNPPLIDGGVVEPPPVPRDHPLVVGVSRDDRRLEKRHEAFRVAHVLGRTAPLHFDEYRVVDSGIALAQRLHDDVVPQSSPKWSMYPKRRTPRAMSVLSRRRLALCCRGSSTGSRSSAPSARSPTRNSNRCESVQPIAIWMRSLSASTARESGTSTRHRTLDSTECSTMRVRATGSCMERWSGSCPLDRVRVRQAVAECRHLQRLHRSAGACRPATAGRLGQSRLRMTLEAAQEAEHGGDLGHSVLVDVIQTHQRVEDDEARAGAAQSRSGVGSRSDVRGAGPGRR